jgi:copper homeostasis protein
LKYSGLENGGLTPSVKLKQKACSGLNIPVMAMDRPRAGNFIFNPDEIEHMKYDKDLDKKAGVYVAFPVFVSDYFLILD